MSFDLDILEKGGKEFDKLLESVPDILNNTTVKPFLKAIINVINNPNTEEESLQRSIIALCKAASKKEYVDDFISLNVLKQLPYNNEIVQEQIFDLLYVVAATDAKGITKEVCQLFEPNIKVAPRKALGVLAEYASHYDKIKDKAKVEVLDLLLSPASSEPFRQRLYVKEYVSLIANLIIKNNTYRSQRFQQCWDAVCACLSVNRDESVVLCYWVLSVIAEQCPNNINQCQFPCRAVSCHLRRRNVQKAAIDLLIRYAPASTLSAEVVQSLVWAAQTDLRANLVLARIATEERISKFLVVDANWMTKDLPTKIDTLRIFAIVLSHKGLRDDIAEKSEPLAFLRGIVELNTPGILSAVTTFVRRLPLTPQYVQYCSDYGLLSAFLQYGLERDDTHSIEATLLFIDTFSKVCYVRDFLEVCDYVSALVTKEGPVSQIAARVAVDLAKYPKCAIKFQKSKLDVYFFENKNSPKVKKAAIPFLKNVKKAYQNMKELQKSPKKSAQNSPVVKRGAKLDVSPERTEVFSPLKKSNKGSDSDSSSSEIKNKPPPPPRSSSSSSDDDTKATKQKQQQQQQKPQQKPQQQQQQKTVTIHSSSSDDSDANAPQQKQQQQRNKKNLSSSENESSSEKPRVQPPQQNSYSEDEEEEFDIEPPQEQPPKQQPKQQQKKPSSSDSDSEEAQQTTLKRRGSPQRRPPQQVANQNSSSSSDDEQGSSRQQESESTELTGQLGQYDSSSKDDSSEDTNDIPSSPRSHPKSPSGPRPRSKE